MFILFVSSSKEFSEFITDNNVGIYSILLICSILFFVTFIDSFPIALSAVSVNHFEFVITWFLVYPVKAPKVIVFPSLFYIFYTKKLYFREIFFTMFF